MGGIMLLSWVMMKLLDPTIDEAMVKMLAEDYSDNPFLMVTIAEKMSPRAMRSYYAC